MIYFDNAATSFPKSKKVLREVEKAMLNCGNPGRSGHSPSLFASKVLYDCRERVAAFLGTLPEKVVLTPSATVALNFAIKGYAHKKIVMSSLEHNAVVRPAYSLSESIENNVFETYENDIFDDEKIIENFEKATDNADMAVITLASNVCGRILPVKRLCEIASRKNIITVIDGSQGIGYIPFNLKEIKADIVCFPGHKGLGGPMGTGCMVFSESFDKVGKTTIEGGTGIYSFDKEMPETIPERFEGGTIPAHDFAGLSAAIKSINSSGIEGEIFSYIIEELKNMKKIKLYGEPKNKKDENNYVPVILFNIENIPFDDVSDFLSENEICTRSGFHCAPLAHETIKSNGGVRISVGHNNTRIEAMILIDRINRLASGKEK